MQRATPVQMRKALELVEVFKNGGLWFVPMPVFDEDDFNSRVTEMEAKLEGMAIKLEKADRQACHQKMP